MAGTNRSRGIEGAEQRGPAIILVEPQLGDNIGAAARAMLNCGLMDMRLVRPRDGWPNPRAEAMASGALVVLDQARVYQSTAEAVAELDLVLATTARERDVSRDVLTPRAAAERLHLHTAKGGKTGILFGPERAGLVNDDAILADAVINVPLNPGFSSLNLAQAVLLVGYEWYQAYAPQDSETTWGDAPPATVEQREYFFTRLEEEMDTAGFLFPPHLAPTIRRNIRAMFTRANLTDQEVRTMHGVLSALIKPRNRNADNDTSQ
jgi:tRNA/rRNA methyltransferase